MPLSPGGVIPRDMDARQWDRFVANAGIQADGEVKTFTPTWGGGFSSDPTGEISYLDFGAIVVMWSEGTTGLSNDVFMTWTAGSLPEEIRPSDARVIASQVADGVLSDVFDGSVIVNSDGSATFLITEVSGVRLVSSGNSFTSGGFSVKGLPPGWLIMYAK